MLCVQQLSVYILTCNSPKYLPDILARCNSFADEIVIVDSGSTDNTLDIARSFNCKIFNRPLDNFREQRRFAHNCCTNQWVLAIDSDEIPSDDLIKEIQQLKAEGFKYDAYKIRRNWNVLGKWVHGLVPVPSPDYPIRLLDKNKVVFDERSTRSHETAHGYDILGVIETPLLHYTFETRAELESKLQLYSRLRAEDIIESGKSTGLFQLLLSPIGAWFKWYIVRRNCLDGYTGLILANYAARYTYHKYRIARSIRQQPK